MLILRRQLEPPEPPKDTTPSEYFDNKTPVAVEPFLSRIARMERPDRRAMAYGTLNRMFVTTGLQVQVAVSIEGHLLGWLDVIAPRAGIVDGYALFQWPELELVYE